MTPTRQFCLSFAGSLLAGILLLGTAPAWWERWWDWVTSPSQVVRHLPPASLDAKAVRKLRAKCKLEAMQVPIPRRMIRRGEPEMYRAYAETLCLESVGFTRTVETEVDSPSKDGGTTSREQHD